MSNCLGTEFIVKNHQLINQTSSEVEFYTPPHILEAVRRTLGGIELDPFSSAQANKRVLAERFFTAADDGLKQEWVCKTFWMNHPFGRDTNELCIQKAEAEYLSGRALSGCCITFAATSEKWFQPLLRRPQCFLSPRTNYYLPDGTLKKGVTKGSVVTYFGTDYERFARVFSGLGVVKLPASMFVL